MDIDQTSVTIYASNIFLSLLGFVGTAYSYGLGMATDREIRERVLQMV